MAFLISPGVEIKEIDLTNVVPALATSTGAYAGHFTWGPIGQLVTVSSEKDLISNFGAPDASTAKSFFTAASFLKYGNNLKVSRAINTDASNAYATRAGVTGTAKFYRNFDEWEALSEYPTDEVSIARYPGAAGNSLKVIIARPSIGDWGSNLLLSSNFSEIPSSTQYAQTYASNVGANSPLDDEIHVLVIDSQGLFTGVPGSVLERYEGLSLASDAKTETGASNYYFNVINRSSKYIYITKLSGIGISEWDNADRPLSQVYSSTGGGTETVRVLNSNGTESSKTVTFDFNDVDGEGDLVPIVLEPAIIDNQGKFVTVAITASDTLGGVIENITESTSIELTVSTSTVIDPTDEDEVPVITSDVYNLTVAPNVSSEITILDGLIDIIINEGATPITVTFEEYETVTYGSGYAAATVLGLQDISLGNGLAGNQIAPGNITEALSFFEDKETVDVNLIFAETFEQEGNNYAGSIQKTIDNQISTLVNLRKDCIGFISAPLNIFKQTSDNQKKQILLNKAQEVTKSSYLVMDSTPVYVYNKYTDSYLWISACGHMAGLCANADRVADAWFSPAGFNRGNVLGVTKLAYNPDVTSRDDLYKLGVNSIVSFPGQGIVLYGDKTLQSKPSAFDRINVRRLFITLEKAIATAAKFQLFEQNDEFTRSAFRNSIEPFLRDVQGRRGITEFRVVCDSSNNTGEIIDGNRFVADIYIKPTRSINYITLNFVATRTGVAFTEIVG
jgi:hypothetical protein